MTERCPTAPRLEENVPRDSARRQGRLESPMGARRVRAEAQAPQRRSGAPGARRGRCGTPRAPDARRPAHGASVRGLPGETDRQVQVQNGPENDPGGVLRRRRRRRLPFRLLSRSPEEQHHRAIRQPPARALRTGHAYGPQVQAGTQVHGTQGLQGTSQGRVSPWHTGRGRVGTTTHCRVNPW